MTSGSVDERAAQHRVWLKGRASCGQGKLSRDRRERVRGSQERRGRDLDGLFPAPTTPTLAPKTQPRRRSVILEGILMSIPEFFTWFSRVNGGGLCGWERAEDCSPAQLVKNLQSFARLASKFLFNPLGGAALRDFGDLSCPPKKWKTAGGRQNHGAEARSPPMLAVRTWRAQQVPRCPGGLGAVQLRRYGGCSGIRCSVQSNTQARRARAAAAPLMICLEPSSLSLGNLEIRHGAAPGAF